MDHEIYTWLNSQQDYTSGILLYDRYCKNSNLGRILRIGGATGKNRLTLAYELGKVFRHIVSYHVINPSETQKENHIKDKDKPVQIPAILIEDIRKEQKMIYKMLDNLHAVLPFRGKNERARIAFEILDLDDRLKELAVRIDHYEKTGLILPEPDKKPKNNPSEKDSAALIKRQYSVRTYLTRYKKLLEESESLKDRDRYQKKLDEYLREMEAINKKLGG
jgi:hypothetical protein